MSSVAIEYCNYTIKIYVTYQNNFPSIYGNGKQMKECDNTSLLQRSGLLIPYANQTQSFRFRIHFHQKAPVSRCFFYDIHFRQKYPRRRLGSAPPPLTGNPGSTTSWIIFVVFPSVFRDRRVNLVEAGKK